MPDPFQVALTQLVHRSGKGDIVYPADLNTNNNDFIEFQHYQYRNRDERNKQIGLKRSGYATQGPSSGHKIKIYTPNSTPATRNTQGWKGQSFPGERGQYNKQVLQFLGGMGGGPGFNPGSMRGVDPGELAKQITLDYVTSFIGSDASTALQLAKGQVYNPNIEMLYTMPTLRTFQFRFNFVPKDKADAEATDRVIREFKYWSAPGVTDEKFIQVPDLWTIKYFESFEGTSKLSKRMNVFKALACTDVTVQENPANNYHMMINDPDGAVPTHTELTLTFQETDIVTRTDHDNAMINGYMRDY